MGVSVSGIAGLFPAPRALYNCMSRHWFLAREGRYPRPQVTRLLVVCALCMLSSLSAQHLPDAERLLKQIAQAARSFRALEYVVKTVIEEAGSDDPDKTTMEISCAFAEGGRVRLASTVDGAFLIVSDGRTTWQYDSTLNEDT